MPKFIASIGLILLGLLLVFLTFVLAGDYSYESLKDGYQNLWNQVSITSDRASDVDDVIDNKFLPNQARYEKIQDKLGIPWYVVAVIHYREGNCNFKTHLHNGDPLTARTVHYPRGRPPKGKPPFTWEESAIDALILEGLDKVDDWSITAVLYQLEKFNGFGYFSRKIDINSPYLWSGTNFYKIGKFDADGHYNARLVDRQLGVVTLLKRMIERGIIQIDEQDHQQEPDDKRDDNRP